MSTKIVAISEGPLSFAMLDEKGKIHNADFTRPPVYLGVPIDSLTKLLNSIELLPSEVPYTQISYGKNILFALDSTGRVWTYGANHLGQLWRGDTRVYNKLVPTNLMNIKAISAGFAHGLALTNSGEVFQWGSIDNRFQSKTPWKVNRLKNIRAIAAGSTHNLALNTKGEVFSWGQNYNLQLGIFGKNYQEKPKKINNIPSINKIAAGEEKSLLLTKDGDVWGFGKLITYRTILQRGRMPHKINLPSSISTIAMGWNSCFALNNNQELWGWGQDISLEPTKLSLEANMLPILFQNPASKAVHPEDIDLIVRHFLKQEITL